MWFRINPVIGAYLIHIGKIILVCVRDAYVYVPARNHEGQKIRILSVPSLNYRSMQVF